MSPEFFARNWPLLLIIAGCYLSTIMWGNENEKAFRQRVVILLCVIAYTLVLKL